MNKTREDEDESYLVNGQLTWDQAKDPEILEKRAKLRKYYDGMHNRRPAKERVKQ